MPINNATPNYAFPLPHADNELPYDVARLITALGLTDAQIAIVAAQLAGKASAASLADYILLSAKGAANGVATLDGTTKIPEAQLPDSIKGATKIIGVWNALTNTPAIPVASASNRGNAYRVTAAGTTSIDGIAEWAVGDLITCTFNGASTYSWIKIDSTDAVASVAGLMGSITAAALTAALVALAGDSGAGGTKGLPPAPAAGDGVLAKALLASGGWGFSGEASTFLATAVALSGTSFTFNATTITKAYKRFRLIAELASHNSGSNQSFEIALSGDNGSTWSADFSIQSSVTAAIQASINLEILRCNELNATRIMTSGGITSVSSPITNSIPVATGYINGIRIKPSGGSWDGGTVSLIGYL